MAIRFVDKEPEAAEAKPKAAERATEAAPPPPEPTSDGAARDAPSDHPESRRRAVPPSSAEAGSGLGEPTDDGLLPGLVAHAKPTPKPRGRKKAFG